MILLRTLGDCTIEIGERRLAPDSEVLFSLLAYFIVERGRPIPRSVLLEFFWADEEDSKARHCLRQSIYKLRQMGVPIETRNDRYVLAAAGANSDSELLSAEDRIQMLGKHELTILPGFGPHASNRFATWLEDFRDRTLGALRRVLVSLLSEARRRNDWDRARRLAELCLVVDPLNEEATLTVAEAMAMEGSKGEAVKLLDSYCAEIGSSNQPLGLPARVLKARISERVSHSSTKPSLPPFTGRDNSLALLRSLAANARQGNGRTCLVFGEPGIGKTRLLSEFGRGLDVAGVTSVRVGCQPSSKDRPMSIFMELVPKLLVLPGSLGCAPESLQLIKRLSHFDPSANAVPISADVDVAQLNESMRRAVGDLLDSVAQENPIVVIVEDTHWIDRVSWSLLSELIASNGDRALLLIITSRNSAIREMTSSHDIRQLIPHELRALPDEACRIVATRLADSSRIELPRSVLEWCISHSSGNPLYLLELFAHWRDTGDAVHVPAPLESLIRERLQQLSPCALQLLQASSLLGFSSTFERLERALQMPRWQLLDGLAELDNAGLASSLPEGIRPRHDLVAQASIEKLSEQGRRLLHLAIGEVLSVQPSHPADLWDAATHFGHAGANQRALDLAIQCATHALSVGLAHEAADLLGRAEVFATTDSEMLRLCNARREPLRIAGVFKELLRVAEKAVEIESRDLSPGEACHSDNELVVLLVNATPFAANRNGGTQRAYSCLTSASATTSHRLEAALWGLVACTTDALDTDAEKIANALAAVAPTNDQERRHALNCQLIYHTEFGDIDRAIQAGDELLALEQCSSSAASLSRALRVSAWPYRLRGDIRFAQRRLLEASGLARERHLDAMFVMSALGVAQTFCDQRDALSAWDTLQEMGRLLDQRPQLTVPAFFTQAAEVALLIDDLQSAQKYLLRAEAVTNAALRYEIDRVALRAEIGLRNLDKSAPRTISRLRSLCTRLRLYSGQQFAVGSLCACLTYVGRVEEASLTAREYTEQYRRERWPVRDARILACLPARSSAC